MNFIELVAILVALFQHYREIDNRKDLVSKVVKLGFDKYKFIDELDYLNAFALFLALEKSYPKDGEALYYQFASTLMQSFGYTNVNMHLTSRFEMYRMYWEENIEKGFSVPLVAEELLSRVGFWAVSFAYGKDSKVPDEITEMFSKKFREYCRYWREQIEQSIEKTK